MTPQLLYSISLIVSVLAMIVTCVYISRLKDAFMYEFRNVLIAALIPFWFLLTLVLLSWLPVRDTFDFMTLVFDFPAAFANASIAGIAVLAAAMAVSNAALIRHEGMAVKNTVGTMLQLGWIAATIAVYALVCVLKAHTAELTGPAGFLCSWLPYFLYCLIDYGECMMIGMMIMGWVAAHGKSAYDKDFIIIPGCSISKTGGLLPLLKGRVNRAMRYAWEQEMATGKPVYYIPSGGQGPDEVMSEGSAMAMYLLAHSAEDYEVFPEKQSRNTAENFLLSAKIVREQNPEAKVAFATTNYHVLRCGMLAKKAGLTAEGLASSTKWYFWPNGFAREVAAIVSMTRKYHAAAFAVIFCVSLLVTLTSLF